MRERMITRTVITVNYGVMVVDSVSKTVDNITVSIPSGDVMTEKNRDKAIKASIPDGKLFVQVVSQNTTEVLYGMPESEFIRLARVLPPRTKAE